MEFLFELVSELIVAILEAVFEGGFRTLWGGERFTTAYAEWIGYLGACAWMIVSLGRIEWENNDWRSIATGNLLLGGGGVLAWTCLSHAFPGPA